MKTCRVCRQQRPIERFYLTPSGNPRNVCIPCFAAQSKLWKQTHPEAVLRINRRYRYDLEPEDYNRLLAAQEGVCAICRQPCPTGRPLSVDHDADSLQVRGLLCFNCNTGIGKFYHSPELLKAAVVYLEV